MTPDDRAADKRVLPEVLRAEWERLDEIARIRARLARIDAGIARLERRNGGPLTWQ